MASVHARSDVVVGLRPFFVCRWPILALALIVGLTEPGSSMAAEKVDFVAEVVPILQQHCIRCHVPGNEKGDFSLATAEDMREWEYVVAGDPDSSHLVELISASAEEPPAMPAEGQPLSDSEVALIRRWIADGAVWPDGVIVTERSKADSRWWSLQPLAHFDASGPNQMIDDLVLEKLSEQGLSRNPPADRRELIRRATYDLTGLPPTPSEVDAFVADKDPDAYERLIDRLLDSPRYGERWGRHWLDVVRFGESNGFERNVIISTLWPFRDYVIRSLNDDVPMDQFIRQHIAGDVLGADDPDIAVGSAFLVAGPYDDVGNQDPVQQAQIRANTIDEMIRATSEAFLGLTVGCARCHNHKFDPITQEDYYGLYATLAGVRHGETPLATTAAKQQRAAELEPLNREKEALERTLAEQKASILERAKERIDEHSAGWVRDSVDRTGTEERFDPVTAKFVRLVCEANDIRLNGKTFRIDEFEVWSTDANEQGKNVALAANGGKASGAARRIEDFPGAYGPQHTIDGKSGERFISAGPDLTIELAEPTRIDRVVFSSARGESTPEHSKFSFVAEYRIEVSDDGVQWREVANGRDRNPVAGDAHRDHRLLQLETNEQERAEQAKLSKSLAAVKRKVAQVPNVPKVWIGTRVEADAKGPFHIFLGGSPQKKGDEVSPKSFGVLDKTPIGYHLPPDSAEGRRRLAFADWTVDPQHPLTPRVLANRIWHYHFGTGIVDTPSDFGYMGGRPSHPRLLDWLATELLRNRWRLKPLHKQIMMSQTYRQTSRYRAEAARVDGDARLLWRFPPRRLSAEEVRDTMLSVAGKLDLTMGGPGFRLYHFMQDNVCTYVPLDQHGPETYRRAVYHQNARASVVDLMTEFDQPDCAFSISRRAQTTTPLQALTMLNHQFTIDMAAALAERLQRETPSDPNRQIETAYRLCYGRRPTADETKECCELIDAHGLPALCRVLLNTSELIYVR